MKTAASEPSALLLRMWFEKIRQVLNLGPTPTPVPEDERCEKDLDGDRRCPARAVERLAHKDLCTEHAAAVAMWEYDRSPDWRPK
jgi:hypothetical protein